MKMRHPSDAYSSKSETSTFDLSPNGLHEWCDCQTPAGFLLKPTPVAEPKNTQRGQNRMSWWIQSELCSPCVRKREREVTFSRKAVQPCAPTAESVLVSTASSSIWAFNWRKKKLHICQQAANPNRLTCQSNITSARSLVCVRFIMLSMTWGLFIITPHVHLTRFLFNCWHEP